MTILIFLATLFVFQGTSLLDATFDKWCGVLIFLFTLMPDVLEPMKRQGGRHRGVWHGDRALKACLLLLAIFFAVGLLTNLFVLFFAVLGYTSHLLGDLATARGLPP